MIFILFMVNLSLINAPPDANVIDVNNRKVSSTGVADNQKLIFLLSGCKLANWHEIVDG